MLIKALQRSFYFWRFYKSKQSQTAALFGSQVKLTRPVHSSLQWQWLHRRQASWNVTAKSSTCISISESTMESIEKSNGGDSEQTACSKLMQVENDTKLSKATPSKQLKKMARKAELKVLEKARKRAKKAKNQNAGFGQEVLQETSYYFENGLRKVVPYHFTYNTYTKQRWIDKPVVDVFSEEFRHNALGTVPWLVDNGLITVNGGKVALDYRLKDGDLISHTTHRHELPVRNERIEVLECSEDVVVVNKPSSLPVHPCGKYRHNSLVFLLASDYGIANLRTVYRLDRLTSGVLVFGRTYERTVQLEGHISQRLVTKQYLARVVGEFPSEPVTCEEPLDVLDHKLGLFRVSPDGKAAKTDFIRVGFDGETSVVKCMPHTGRTHQIRIHLQHLGHPIVNDPLYNCDAWGPKRGAGGEYGKSLEQVIEDIKLVHTVDKWWGEPMESGAATQKQHNNSSATNSAKVSQSVDSTSADRSDQTAKTDDGDVSPPPDKVPRLEGSALQRGAADQANVVCSTAVRDMPSKDTTVVASEDAVRSKDLTETTTEAVRKSPGEETESERVATEGPLRDGKADGGPDGSEEGGGSEHRGYCAECSECQRRAIDPVPEDMLIYLHAYRYSGPDWDYSAPLPPWAECMPLDKDRL